MNQGFLPRSFILLLLALLTVTLIDCAASGENTPPTVVIDTPKEAASMALTVTISGKATDTEGFNIDSYVEALWNDWEWFTLPNTPTGGNSTLVFGELVNLDWHAPGEHLLQVRAFDGELYSEVAQVNVTVRDLADLVILPTDITMDPKDARVDDRVKFFVVVRNQGGEDVPDVEVVLTMNGNKLGRKLVDRIEANSQATAVFEFSAEKSGDSSLLASVHSLQQIQEKSLINNEAERYFTIQDIEAVEWAIGWGLFGVGLVMAFILFWLAVFIFYRVVVSRKD